MIEYFFNLIVGELYAREAKMYNRIQALNILFIKIAESKTAIMSIIKVIQNNGFSLKKKMSL